MRLFNHPKYKNLQLTISAIIVISVSVVYGGNPSVFMPYMFGFEVQDIDLKNILRALMGIYLAFGTYWIMGIFKSEHWRNAAITNVLFMGGLAFGRIISTLFDGVSPQFSVGLVLEIIFFFWGWYNLKVFGTTKISS